MYLSNQHYTRIVLSYCGRSNCQPGVLLSRSYSIYSSKWREVLEYAAVCVLSSMRVSSDTPTSMCLVLSERFGCATTFIAVLNKALKAVRYTQVLSSFLILLGCSDCWVFSITSFNYALVSFIVSKTKMWKLNTPFFIHSIVMSYTEHFKMAEPELRLRPYQFPSIKMW